ncbi:MAG: hypothetical protein Q8K92_22895 [Leadbetterella sp.]|nr:hypothetical protein [Leadbetterella sp.]
MIKYIVCLLLFSLIGRIYAQVTFQHSIGVGLTSKGIQSNYFVRSDSSRWSYGIRALGYGYKKTHNFQTGGESFVLVEPAIQKVQIDGLVRFWPFAQKNWINLDMGLGYDIFPTYAATISTPTGILLNNLEITSENFGSIDMNLKWNKFLPFFGVNFDKKIFQDKFNLGFDLGAYYLGKPKLDIQYDGFLESIEVESEIQKIEKNLSHYNYYPFLGFRLNYNWNRNEK